MPILVLLVVGGAIAFVLSQPTYRDAIAGCFGGKETKESADGESPIDSWNAVDLLKLVDVRRDVVAGTWRRDGETLVSPDNAAARVMLPYIPPREYELTIVAEPVAGNAGLVIGLVAEGHQATAVVDLKGNISGLATSSSFEFPDPATAHDLATLKLGKATTIVCRVRKHRAEIEADGKTVVDYRGNLDRLTVNDLWRVSDPRVLYIGSAVSSYRISKVALVPIAGKGQALEKAGD